MPVSVYDENMAVYIVIVYASYHDATIPQDYDQHLLSLPEFTSSNGGNTSGQRS